MDRDIELFQIYLLKIKTFDVYSIDVSSLLRCGIGRAAIYDNSDKNPKMKILCPQKFYLSVNINPVQIKIAVED